MSPRAADGLATPRPRAVHCLRFVPRGSIRVRIAQSTCAAGGATTERSRSQRWLQLRLAGSIESLFPLRLLLLWQMQAGDHTTRKEERDGKQGTVGPDRYAFFSR